jgi:hypothetical protein
MTGLPAIIQALMGDMRPLACVLEKQLASGSVRYVLDFGYRNGKRVRLFSTPGAGGRPLPFLTREQAQRALDLITLQVRAGTPLDAVLDSCRGREAPQHHVDHHLAAYLQHWRERVETRKRSANTLREIERYAEPDGHLSYWRGRSVRSITYGELEDFHLWLARRGLSAKSQRNVSGVLRAMLRWLKRRGTIDAVPEFPVIEVAKPTPTRIISMDEQARILAAIPWPRRGGFLAAAHECMRLSEVRACDLDDWDGNELVIDKAVQGPRRDAPIRTTKNKSAVRRRPWSDELRRWLAWRLEQATPASRLRGQHALFWNPSARSTAKRWTPDSMEREWARACDRASVPRVPFQQGTRHATLTALGQHLPERVLRAFSRHRDARSLDHYAQPQAAPETIAAVLRLPGRSLANGGS